jgi:Flp pilus assembly protein TadD/cell division protein FtsN
MRHFVRQVLRGSLFCLVAISVTACSNLLEELQGDQSGMYPAVKADSKVKELTRIDKIRIRVAQNALSNEDYPTAIRFFEAVHESSPGHALPLIGLGEANLGLGKMHEAETAYRKAVSAEPDSAKALEGLGTILVSRGAFEDAITHFNRSLAQVPSASLHNKLGVAHDLKGDGSGAQRHYRAALALDPNIVSARNNLALSLVVSEAYDEAIGEMERVAAHPDATPRHQQNLAFVYGMAGRFDSASAKLSENGMSKSEVVRNRALFNRMREMAKEGNRTELLAFLRNANPGDNLAEADLTQSAAVSPDLSSAVPEAPEMTTSSVAPSSQDTLRSEDKVIPPKSMEQINKFQDSPSGMSKDMSPKPGTEKSMTAVPKRDKNISEMPQKETMPETGTQMAKLSDPVTPMAAKAPLTLPDVDLASGPYRVQLASYRTSEHAARGQRVLAMLLQQDPEKLGLFVRKSREEGSTAFDFRIRTAAIEKREDGQKLCGAIKANGHDGCLVIKHNDSLWESLKIDPPAPEPVRVQLASFRTEKGAEKGQNVLKRLLGEKAGDLEILVRRTLKGTFNYRIRTSPFKNRAEAQQLCDAFKAAGHPDCIIIKQNDSIWKTAATLSEVEHASVTTRFRIQLASYRSRKNAFVARDRLAKLLGEPIDPAHQVTTVEFVTNAKDRLYRVLVSDVRTQERAAQICEEARAAGHKECLVVSQASTT